MKTAKTKHKECSPVNFWLSMASSYWLLASHAFPQLPIFPFMWESRNFQSWWTSNRKIETD